MFSVQLEAELFSPLKFRDQGTSYSERNKKHYYEFKEKHTKKKVKSKKKNRYSLPFQLFLELLSDDLFSGKNIKSSYYPFKVIPRPCLKSALSNKQHKRRNKLARKQNKFFTLVDSDFSPYPYRSKFQKKVYSLKPSSIGSEFSGRLKWPKTPKYWKSLHQVPEFCPNSAYQNFIENFGEKELLSYDSDNATVNLLQQRYFENHLSRRELFLKINQEISVYLNKIMNLLNEQFFAVYPLGASPILYAILPELDGISRELKKYNLDPNLRKRVSYIDIPVRSMQPLPRNILSSVSASMNLQTDSYRQNIRKNWEKLLKFKDFHIDEFSLSCYSELSQYFLSGLFRTATKRLNKFLFSRLSFWNLLNSCFLIDNNAFSWSGEAPIFEKEVVGDNYRSNSFTQPRLFWERECENIKKLDSSIRKERPKRDFSSLLE